MIERFLRWLLRPILGELTVRHELLRARVKELEARVCECDSHLKAIQGRLDLGLPPQHASSHRR